MCNIVEEHESIEQLKRKEVVNDVLLCFSTKKSLQEEDEGWIEGFTPPKEGRYNTILQSMYIKGSKESMNF